MRKSLHSVRYKKVFLVGLLFMISGAIGLFAQPISVIDSSGQPVLYINQDKIVWATDHTVAYTVKGNLIFSGDSDRKEDIAFMYNASDIFSRKTGQLLTKQNMQPVLAVARGNVFLGSVAYRNELLLGNLQKTDTSLLFLPRAGSNPIFEIKTKTLSPAFTMAITHIFIMLYKLDQALIDSLSARAPRPDQLQGGGIIRRLWSQSGQEDFIWDGRILRNRWNFNDFECWTYDGETIRRAYYHTNEDLIWDGKTLRRKWLQDDAYFVVEGQTIRKVFGEIYDEFYIHGQIVRRIHTPFGTDEWEIAGEVPLPLIILVIFRIAR